MNRSSARRPRSGLHCREAVARSSRSPIGDCYDCAMCESFVRDLKRPGFARCGHLRGRVSQGPMEGRKRKTRVALPSRNGGNDQPSTESGQLHLSSRRQRCDDPLNPPWQPWSEWWITALAGRCPSAMLSASSTRLGAQASRIRCWTSPMERLDSFARSRSTFPGPSANAEKNDDADFAVKFELPRAGQFCGRRRSQAGSPPSQVRPSPAKSGQVRLFGRAHSATRSALSQHSSETGSLRTPPTRERSRPDGGSPCPR